MKISLEILNLDKFLGSLKRYEEDVQKGIKKALAEIGFHLLGESINQTPIDTGNLRGSGVVIVDERVIGEGGPLGVRVVSIASKKSSGEVVHEVFVGYNTHYAIFQHENMENRHTDPGAKAKFLEDPLRQNFEKYHKKIADAIRNVSI